jgi:hypothetical protein
VPSLLEHPHPNFIVTDFILFLASRNVKPYARLNAKSAAIFLLEQLRNIQNLGQDRMVREFVAATASAVKTKSKYTTIWDISLNYSNTFAVLLHFTLFRCLF